MNRYFLIEITALILLLLVSGVSANPPSDLNLTYNQTSGNLSATFTHQVADPATHYLKNVRIWVDGNETINEDYTSQPTSDVFSYVYPLNVNEGTMIEVSGECNIFGSIKESLII